MFHCFRARPPRGIFSALLFGAAALFAADTAYGQGAESGGYLREAFNRVTNNANIANKIQGYGYADGLSILGGWIDAGQSLEFGLNHLTPGVSYVIIGSGDNDAEDVDVEVRDPNGNLVARDVRLAADAVIEFVPRVRGNHRMRLVLYKARQNVPCVCVATVLKRDGWNIPFRNLDDTVNKMIKGLTVADQTFRARTGRRLDLHKARNQWAIYGGVARQGEKVSVIDMNLGRGHRLFLGAGDNNSRDVDLFLYDGGNREINKDVKIDPVAVFNHEMFGGSHGLTVLNYQSNGPSLLMMAIFEPR